MKKITLLLAAFSMVALSSCKKEEKETSVETTTTETIVPADDTDAPPPPPVVKDTVAADADGTSINVNSGGVSVDSKDGSKKTTVNVSKDNAGVEIKK